MTRKLRQMADRIDGWKTTLLVVVGSLYVGYLIHVGKLDAEIGIGLLVTGLIPLAMNHRNGRYHRDIRDRFDDWETKFGGGGSNKSKREEYGI